MSEEYGITIYWKDGSKTEFTKVIDHEKISDQELEITGRDEEDAEDGVTRLHKINIDDVRRWKIKVKVSIEGEA